LLIGHSQAGIPDCGRPDSQSCPAIQISAAVAVARQRLASSHTDADAVPLTHIADAVAYALDQRPQVTVNNLVIRPRTVKAW
jgi:hypothetical protein